MGSFTSLETHKIAVLTFAEPAYLESRPLMHYTFYADLGEPSMFARNILFTFCMVFNVAAVAGAYDDLIKKQKPGMWQITRSGNASNFDATGNPMDSRETFYFCLIESNRDEAREASGTAISYENCRVRSEKVDGAKIDLIMVCGRNTADAVTIKQSGVFNEDRYRTESEITMPAHIRAAKKMTEVTEGKLLRPCRKGEAPGLQETLPNG